MTYATSPRTNKLPSTWISAKISVVFRTAKARRFAERKTTIGRSNRRNGLATLELVLSAPILLLMMGLIVAVGAAAAWKFRAQTEARNIAGRNLWPRGGEFAAYRPPEWQQPKQAGWSAGDKDTKITAPAYEMPVVRGPLGNFTVNSDLFDPTTGLDKGTAYISRKMPMLPKVTPYKFSEENAVLDAQWQFRQQGMESNFYHRINKLYQMPEPPSGLLQQLTQATQQATTIHNSTAMRPLDQDAEFMAWYGSAPSFYPRLRTFTSLDVDIVDAHYVQPLVKQIEGDPNNRRRRGGVPRRLTQAFLGMYNQMQKTLMVPPPGLQTKIDELNAFLKKL